MGTIDKVLKNSYWVTTDRLHNSVAAAEHNNTMTLM
jgi:hypothetical protein